MPASSSSLFGLAHTTTLVTGGATGIGLAISRTFREAGGQVILVGRRENMLKQACKKLGKGASYCVADISKPEIISELVTALSANGQFPDILVNNAGVNAKAPTLDVTDEEFSRIVQTNLNGLFSLTREVAREMAARKKGVILNITSMAALYGIPRVAAYTATKAAVLGLTRALAVEWASSGIRVNAIAPGFIHSEMTMRALDSDPERKRRVLERTPMNRMGEASEVAAAALFLCSAASSFITGVNLPVDGGNSIGF